jgi:hypothetical protein
VAISIGSGKKTKDRMWLYKSSLMSDTEAPVVNKNKRHRKEKRMVIS